MKLLAVLFDLPPTLIKQLGLLSVSCFSLNKLAFAVITLGKTRTYRTSRNVIRHYYRV